MGERLSERDIEVDGVISSPATRAIATAEAIALELDFPWDEVVLDERLYHADEFEMLEVIQELDDDLDCVMCFGHNPGLTDLVNYLSPYYVDNVPSCGVVELTFDVDTWALVGDIEPVDVDFDYPKKRR
jgi:phosphohistidine phosphatase